MKLKINKGGNEVDYSTKLQEEAQLSKQFANELIFENIILWNEVLLLRKELKELKRLHRWWEGDTDRARIINKES
jgi:hypothetical protein